MNRRLAIVGLLLMTLIGLMRPAFAADFSDRQVILLKLFGQDPITAEMFTPTFLAQVSIEQLLAVFAKTRATIGPPLSIEPDGPSFIVHTATHQMRVDIGLDPDGRIAALLLHPAAQNFTTAEDVVRALDGLRGRVAYLVTRNGAPLYAKSPDDPMAVGSAFKLGVLAALADGIDAGLLHWDQVVKLAAGDVSLPSGTLQTMPVGSPMTLHTLAAFMIAQSDNTATDVLMSVVGRDKVAARLGVDFVLKTTEFFKLKADPALRLRFTSADLAGKGKAGLDMASLPLPDAADVGAPLNPGIEWYVPASKLCSLIETVKDLDVFSINPGVASRADWTQIAFKGGSEAGVASLTTALTNSAGEHFCVSVIWNDSQALDEERFTSLYGSLIGKLAGK